MPTTVLHLDYGSDESPPEGARQAEHTKTIVARSAKTADRADEDGPRDPVEIINRVEKPSDNAIAAEATKGYGMLFIGREPASEGSSLHEQITRSATGFSGPFAIAIARGIDRLATSGTRFNILVPVTGTTVSRRGAELASACAQASRGSLTALHVPQPRRPRPWGRRIGAAIAPMGSADVIIRDIVQLGDPYGVQVRGAVRDVWPPADAILAQLRAGGHNLLVLGVSPRAGAELSFGQVAAELLESAECSILFVASEPFVAAVSEEPETSALASVRAV